MIQSFTEHLLSISTHTSYKALGYTLWKIQKWVRHSTDPHESLNVKWEIRHITNNSNLRNTVVSVVIMVIDIVQFQNMKVVVFELEIKEWTEICHWKIGTKGLQIDGIAWAKAW